MQDQTKRVFRIFFIILMLIMFSLPIFFRARKANLVSRYWPIAKWNSGVMEVKLYGYQDKKTLNIIANSSHAEIMRLDKVINEYDMKSEAGKLKRQFEMGKKNVSVSKELFKLFQFSLDVSKSTKGAFDITVGPLINLWKKSAKKIEFPLPSLLKIFVLFLVGSIFFLKKNIMLLPIMQSIYPLLLVLFLRDMLLIGL